jgi:hypothetical protein
MGFEPTISSVTGWRALRAAPRGRDRCCDRIVPDGLEPSLPGCRPGVVAAGPRDCFFCSHCTGFSIRICKAEAVGLEPTSSAEAATCFRDRLLIQPDDFPAFFKTREYKGVRRPQEGDVAKVTVLVVGYRFCLLSTFFLLLLDSPSASCGGWNRTSGLLIQSQASLPAATAPQFHQGCSTCAKGSGRRIRTFIACFKGRWPTISRSPSVVLLDFTLIEECPAGVGPACPVWKTGAFAARPRARCVFRSELRWQESNLRQSG